MPIHDQGYRRYGGDRRPRRIWWVIARTGIGARIGERRCLALLLLAWAPFAVRAVQIYIGTNFSQAAFLGPTAETFREFLLQQQLFVLFVTIYVGAGLIANDRRAHALQVYLSKPLTRLDYVAGKLVILLVFLTAITWIPAVLLVLLQVMFSGSTAFVRDNLFLLPAITAFCAVQALVSAFAMLALSSLSRSQRFAAVLYAGVVLATRNVLESVAAGAFRVPTPSISAPAFLTVAALIAVSMSILWRQVRSVDVVT